MVCAEAVEVLILVFRVGLRFGLLTRFWFRFVLLDFLWFLQIGTYGVDIPCLVSIPVLFQRKFFREVLHIFRLDPFEQSSV